MDIFLINKNYLLGILFSLPLNLLLSSISLNHSIYICIIDSSLNLSLFSHVLATAAAGFILSKLQLLACLACRKPLKFSQAPNLIILQSYFKRRVWAKTKPLVDQQNINSLHK